MFSIIKNLADKAIELIVGFAPGEDLVSRLTVIIKILSLIIAILLTSSVSLLLNNFHKEDKIDRLEVIVGKVSWLFDEKTGPLPSFIAINDRLSEGLAKCNQTSEALELENFQLRGERRTSPLALPPPPPPPPLQEAEKDVPIQEKAVP